MAQGKDEAIAGTSLAVLWLRFTSCITTLCVSTKHWCFADIAVLIPDPIPVKRGSYKRKIKTECATVQNRNDLYGSINW